MAGACVCHAWAAQGRALCDDDGGECHSASSGVQPYLQKKRLNHVIWRMGRSYLLLTKKSVTPRKPSVASMLIALSMALWKGGITAGGAGVWA